jgi:hypothetical protein
MPTTASIDPDPFAEMPAGDWLMLRPARANAPLVPGKRQLQAESMDGFGGIKPLRPSKAAPPRARLIDPDKLLSRAPPAEQAVGPAAPAALAPAPGPVVTSFDGGSDDNTTIPPDTQGAASRTHFLNPLNNNIHVFDLNNVHAPTVVPLDVFWNRQNCFDPKVVYDPHEDRFFFVTMVDAARATSSLLVAASATADPSGQWHFQTVTVDPNVQGQVWMDYPSLGLTSDKVTVQVNLFTIQNSSPAGSSVYVFDKATLANPATPTAVTRFMLPNQGADQVPAVTYDQGFQDQFLVASWTGNSGGQGYLAVWKITGSPANNTAAITRVGFVSGTRAWDSFPPLGEFAPQSGIPDKLDVGDDRLLSVIYRDGTLHCCHTIILPAGAGARSAVQWWEIPTATWRASVGILDDQNGTTFYAFPTMAINDVGDVLIGHAQFSGRIHPSAAYLFIPSGGASQVSSIFASGQNTYVKRFTGNKNRWGDYTSTQVDHRDGGLAFWTIQEYVSQNQDTWATRIAHIAPPSAQGTV